MSLSILLNQEQRTVNSCVKVPVESPQVLWLSISSHLHQLDRPLLRCLSKSVEIATWQYCQGLDEPGSIAEAVVLLDDYLCSLPQPVHLIGHGMSGVLGLIYARFFPERVKSLSLLSVGVEPAADWQAHYYTRRQALPCSQALVLAQMVRELFGTQKSTTSKWLQALLKRDLEDSLSPHSLWKIDSIPGGGCDVPLWIAGSRDDTVVTVDALRGWTRWLKEGDRLWECPHGRHFFQRFYPQLLENELLQFWDAIERQTLLMHSAISRPCSLF